MPAPKRRRFLIRQKQKRREKRRLVFHSISHGRHGDSFPALKSAVSRGFRGKGFPNAVMKGKGFDLGFMATWTAPSSLPETRGDMYSIEILTRARKMPEDTGHTLAGVKMAHPGQVKKVYVYISRQLSEPEKAKRRAFYARELGPIPVEFIG